jgi:hypothetical protein
VPSTGAKLAASIPNIWLAAGDDQLWGIEQKIVRNYRDTLVEINVRQLWKVVQGPRRRQLASICRSAVRMSP